MILRYQFIFVDKAIKEGNNNIEQEDDDAVKNHKEDNNGIASGDHIDPESEEDSDTGDESEIDDRSISQGKSEKFDEKEKKKKNGFDIVPQGIVYVCVFDLHPLFITV